MRQSTGKLSKHWWWAVMQTNDGTYGSAILAQDAGEVGVQICYHLDALKLGIELSFTQLAVHFIVLHLLVHWGQDD